MRIQPLNEKLTGAKEVLVHLLRFIVRDTRLIAITHGVVVVGHQRRSRRIQSQANVGFELKACRWNSTAVPAALARGITHIEFIVRRNARGGGMRSTRVAIVLVVRLMVLIVASQTEEMHCIVACSLASSSVAGSYC